MNLFKSIRKWLGRETAPDEGHKECPAVSMHIHKNRTNTTPVAYDVLITPKFPIPYIDVEINVDREESEDQG